MSNTLSNIFTTTRAYPRGASTLEMAIDLGLNDCIKLTNADRSGYGAMITRYDAGLYTDDSEKGINYRISVPETNLLEGRCNCTVGSSIAQKLFGGGMLPTARPLNIGDRVIALAMCTGMHEPLLPTKIQFFQHLTKNLNCTCHILDYTTKIAWVIDKHSVIERT